MATSPLAIYPILQHRSRGSRKGANLLTQSRSGTSETVLGSSPRRRPSSVVMGTVCGSRVWSGSEPCWRSGILSFSRGYSAGTHMKSTITAFTRSWIAPELEWDQRGGRVALALPRDATGIVECCRLAVTELIKRRSSRRGPSR